MDELEPGLFLYALLKSAGPITVNIEDFVEAGNTAHPYGISIVPNEAGTEVTISMAVLDDDA